MQIDYKVLKEAMLGAKVRAKESIANIEYVEKILEAQDTERGLTLRAPETAIQDALLKDIMTIIKKWYRSNEEMSALERALRERLFR